MSDSDTARAARLAATYVNAAPDPLFLEGSFRVVVWLGLGIGCYVLAARHRLILTPDEDAARKAAQLSADRATR